MATTSAYESAGGRTMAIRDDTVAVGSHVLEMEGYKKLKAAFRVGEGVHSSSFLVGGHSWHLTCDPRGDGKYSIVDLILCLENPGATDEVRAQFSFALLGPVGEVLCCWEDEEHTFSSSENSYECPFAGRGYLDNFEYVQNERFRMRCDIIIVKEFRPWGKKVWQSPRLDLQRHLGVLLTGNADNVGGDVTFEVAGETFAAHKCILAARSPFFMAKFFGPNNKESITASSAHVRVEDMDPKVFKALLRFIYTDSLPDMSADSDDKVRMLQHPLVAADRYGMERLKLICDDALSYHVDARTAATKLQLAEKHGCPRLKHVCIKFLMDLLDSVAL